MRARELKTTDKGFRRRRIRESPPAPHPTVLATMLPPRSFCQDLVRGKQRRAPRAREPRNFRGAERPSFQLSLKRGGSRRHVCPPVLASREIHLPTRWREGGQGGATGSRNTARCALTASRKNGSPVLAAFSLAPQHYHQSNASRRCANPRTGKSQLSFLFGLSWPQIPGWGATLLARTETSQGRG